MDKPKMERLLRLMKLLSGNVNYTIDELSRKLEMSPRTIYRYIDTFKAAGFSVTKIFGDTYKLGKMPKNTVDLDKLIYFSEEEAYLVNSLIDALAPTNSLKANLKDKLSAIYSQTSIADYVDRKSNAARVEVLGEAVKEKKKVYLKGYESGNSHTVRDRYIEPFGFTTDYIDVWGYDLEDGKNKIFKISRIKDVEVTGEDWTEESGHEKMGMDVFRMNGKTPIHIKLQLTMMSKNLLEEEYPLSAKCIKREGSGWVLDTDIYQLEGAGRFVCGLAKEVTILEGDELKKYVRDYYLDSLKSF